MIIKGLAKVLMWLTTVFFFLAAGTLSAMLAWKLYEWWDEF